QKTGATFQSLCFGPTKSRSVPSQFRNELSPYGQGFARFSGRPRIEGLLCFRPFNGRQDSNAIGPVIPWLRAKVSRRGYVATRRLRQARNDDRRDAVLGSAPIPNSKGN